jgi:hypothetical protein
MSTATIDAPETNRRPSSTRKTGTDTQPRLVEARQHAETAMTDLVSATSETFRAFLPAAVLRPSDAVDYTFDLAEQVLAGARRVCVEVAGILESGLDGAERRAA